MKRRDSRRRGADAHPVLKSGGRWPCITVHEPPMLLPQHRFEGDGAVASLLDHLATLATDAGGGDSDVGDVAEEPTAPERRVSSGEEPGPSTATPELDHTAVGDVPTAIGAPEMPGAASWSAGSAGDKAPSASGDLGEPTRARRVGATPTCSGVCECICFECFRSA